MDIKQELTLQDLRRMGGKAKFKKIGSQGMAEMGKKGSQVIKKRHGMSYYSLIRKYGKDWRNHLKELSPTPVKKLTPLE